MSKPEHCPVCDGTGYKDHAGFSMDPCGHPEQMPGIVGRPAFNQYTDAATRFEAHYVVEPNSGCWLWEGSVRGSPRDWRPVMTAGGRAVTAYRYAYEQFVGPIPDGALICHKCNVSICVNPDHLYAGTHSDNVQDAVRAGTNSLVGDGERIRRLSAIVRGQKKGTWRHPNPPKSKLSEEQWVEIERRSAAKEGHRKIAKDYGVHATAIDKMLKRRRIWRERDAELPQSTPSQEQE